MQVLEKPESVMMPRLCNDKMDKREGEEKNGKAVGPNTMEECMVSKGGI